ncbi:MAG TPA: FtsK/SpoIIIE domain-containing protein [Bacillaceae bacterium]
MLEWLVLPAAIGAAAMVPRKRNEKQIIERVFKNRRICIKNGELEQYPKFKSKTVKDSHTTYCFTLPAGIPSEIMESLEPAFAEALNRDIEWEFDGILKIRVFHHKLPESWNYDESLLRPKTWEVPVGKDQRGVYYHDFDKYPHMLAGGTTRFGKTVFLKNMFNSLLLNQPENVEFYILDLKGGLEFYKFAGLQQVKGIACDVYEAAEMLNEIVEGIKQREAEFRAHSLTNVVDTNIKKRTFIIVDEGAELAPELIHKTYRQHAQFCQAALGEIARISGGLGYRLIFCTQYPTRQAVPAQVKINIVTRVSFLIPEQVGSRVILDENGAEELPAIPGRCIYKVEKKRILQAPYITDKQMFKMMEEFLNETGKTRKPVDDDRPPESDHSPPVITHS